MGSGVPIRFSESVVGHRRPAREVGADNDAVYRELLGYGDDHIAQLRAAGVI